MGLLSSKLQEVFTKLKNSSHARILMLGLDAAGKTTILYKVKLDEVVTTVPTIGFNVETVSPCKGITFTMWDIGGQEKLRSLWRYYYKDVDGLLFIVDSADRMRMDEARHELYQLCNTEELRGVPVIVIANKQDLPGALSVSQVTEELQLYRDLRGRKWCIQGACATKGEGIYESMDELVKMVKERRKTSGKEIIARRSF